VSQSRILFPLILGLALLFALITQSIISVTMLELRVQIASERILNFELSSRMLKTRFRQMLSGNENLKSEIKLNVLESSVLNFDKFELDGTDSWLNRFGVVVINGVRRLNLKPPIRIQEDREFMTKLQYAFYMERNRRYDVAFKQYEDMLNSGDNSQNDTRGFLKLHSGYSAALTGRKDVAVSRLEQVIQEYAGTHYAETATVILDILREQGRAAEKIEASGMSDRERAAAYFRAGNFGEALTRFKKLEDLSLDEKYMLSRSYEETGNVKEAISGYIDVVNRGGSSDPAVKSNRRLLLIGNFYNGGKEVREFSQQNATRLGDQEVLRNVEEGKELQLKPVIVEKILKSNDQKQSALVEEIKKELDEGTDGSSRVAVARPALPDETGALRVSVPDRPDPGAITLERPSPPAIFVAQARLKVRFKDGRVVSGTRIAINKDVASVYSGDFEISVPISNMEKIDAADGASALGVTPAAGNGFDTSTIRVEKEEMKFKRGGADESLPVSAIKEIKAK